MWSDVMFWFNRAHTEGTVIYIVLQKWTKNDHNWLASLWLTEKRVYAIHPTQRAQSISLPWLLSIDGCNIIRFRIYNLWMIQWTPFCLGAKCTSIWTSISIKYPTCPSRNITWPVHLQNYTESQATTVFWICSLHSVYKLMISY